jgi:hypothetical protein
LNRFGDDFRAGEDNARAQRKPNECSFHICALIGPVSPVKRVLSVQESGVRSQESGVRSQESGVRSQESGVRIQNPEGRNGGLEYWSSEFA